MKIEYMPHTADIEIKVEAGSPEELFNGALLGMTGILKEGHCIGAKILPLEYSFELNAVDTTCLLIDFLSEVLTLSFTEKALFCRADFGILKEKHLIVRIFGIHANALDEEIKAVTYHGANVRKTGPNEWQTRIIFDI